MVCLLARTSSAAWYNDHNFG